jgi:hypothetical protein
VSKYLDENRILAKVKDKIDGYGREATFYESNDTTPHNIFITPPRQAQVLGADNTNPSATHVCLIAAKDLAYIPVRTNRMLDLKTSDQYRIVEIDPIDSGDLTQAYRLWLAR